MNTTFVPLSTSAGFSIGRGGGGTRFESVEFDGRDSNGDYLVDRWVDVLANGGRDDTVITAANNFRMSKCEVRFCRKGAVRIDKDATEFLIENCRIGPAGRVDDTQTGAARFPDGERNSLEILGANGRLVGNEITGATGACLYVARGEGGLDSSVPGAGYEETQVRGVNNRIQNGFFHLLKVEDLRTDQTEPLSIDVELVNTYWENPGTVKSSTNVTNSITQATGDDVAGILADGASCSVRIFGGPKYSTRRATSAFRAINGAYIAVDMRGALMPTLERLSAPNNQIFDTDGGDTPGFIEVFSMPRISGKNASFEAVLGGMNEAGPGFGRTNVFRVSLEPIDAQARTILYHEAEQLGVILDGTDIGQFTDNNGVITPLTLSTSKTSPFHLQNSTIVLEGDTGGTTTPDQGSVRTLKLPEVCKGRWVLVEALQAWEQVGTTFGASGQPIQAGLRVQPSASGGATIGNDFKVQSVFRPTAPGNGNLTPWLMTRNVIFVQEVGNVDIVVSLTTRDDPVDDKIYVQQVRVALLPGR